MRHCQLVTLAHSELFPNFRIVCHSGVSSKRVDLLCHEEKTRVNFGRVAIGLRISLPVDELFIGGSMTFLKKNQWAGIVLVASSALSLAGQEPPSPSPEQGKHQQMSVASSGRKPNIVLMLTDNLGYGELGIYGGGILRGAPTPIIDKLANEGTRLLNFNVEAQCTPSRSALMTGRFPIRSGTYQVPRGGVPEGLTTWEITLPQLVGTRLRYRDLGQVASGQRGSTPSHESRLR
jgi:Sulfatase